MIYRIEKHGGSLAWHVCRVDTGAMVQRFATKRLATLHMALLAGDKSAAPEWYRRTYAHGKGRLSAHDAGRYAAMSAAQMGLGPVSCNADPETGAPIGVAS